MAEPKGSYAGEFTPELGADYLAGRLGEIEDLGRVDEGRAVSEAASRGLLGQAYEGSAVGSVRAGVRRDKSRALGDFEMERARLAREERLIGERQDYSSSESEKDRAFREKLANMGYEFARGERDAQNRADRISGTQGMIIGGLAGGVSRGLGSYLGGM